ncbi:polysaccharide lyase [Candidatus Gracilibacteria bacterium]|nr:MAG: polysaccharide lyase [Candidatus Gracilibacteria bacterium]
MIKINMITILILLLFSCSKESNDFVISKQAKREFITSFESVKDFNDFYITPQNHLGTTFHELTNSNVHSGTYSHRAGIKGSNKASTSKVNNNHRGYSTVQFQKTKKGPFKTPCYVSLWVWVDMELNKDKKGEDDWLSFATFTDDETDNWARTVLVNLSANGFVHLQHTTNQGEQNSIFQTSTITFPQKQWVELKIFLDFRDNGYAKVWQNGELVSYAKIGNITNKLSQAHFGLYSSPQISSGEVFNDDLKIIEVESE